MLNSLRTLPRRAALSSRIRCPTSVSTGGSCSQVARRCNQEWRAFSSSFGDFDNMYDESSAEEKEEEEKARRAEDKRDELKQKTGRGWTDPWDIEEMLESTLDYDSLPDWSPSLVSRISQERVQIYSKDESKIPTLQDLATLPLPSPPPPHPALGHAKSYALFRKRAQYNYILKRVTAMAEPKIGSIQALPDWQDKQDAVDVLFEEIEFTLKDQEEIIGKHPSFEKMVERALEEYLRRVQKPQVDSSAITKTASETTDKPASDDLLVPVFMDCYDSSKGDSEENTVPLILIPLQPNSKGPSVGRMVEEWELSPFKTSKRIMLRQSTQQIAQALVATTTDESSPQLAARIFVNGRQGVGKTAAIAAIVASARSSGSIVLYLPEGDQMHKNGFYIEANEKREGIFDLPILTQGVCQNMLDAHEDDLRAFQADASTMEEFFTEAQFERFKGYEKGESISLVDLLSYGAEKVESAPMCYSVVVDVLMKQDEKHFIMVLDEFNCFFQPGQYFHEVYDDEVKKPIPYNQISLFKPIMDAMAVTAVVPEDENEVAATPVLMKRGAVIVGTTESHSVARKITDTLTGNVRKTSTSNDAALHVIEVPRLSALEVEHMVANYEATGVGMLRLDRGQAVMNDQEIAYLRMVSGGEAQKLMNACMMD